MTKRVLLSWSSGKDSAWALWLLRKDPSVQVVALLTTVSEPTGRVAMHAVRSELLAAQAKAAGLPLWQVSLPDPCPNTEYAARMSHVVERARADNIDAIAFGDLFLEDIRRYREERLAESGLEVLFPLWQLPTRALAREMLAAGLRAHLASVDTTQLPASLAGRSFDETLLSELPAAADPCGENGEFHTFVSAGPMFREPVSVRLGEITQHDGFARADLLPA